MIMNGFMVIINIKLTFDSGINYYERHVRPRLPARESIDLLWGNVNKEW
jgi:hypothetical protein